MTDELRIGLSELMSKAQVEGDAEFLKEGVGVLSQAIMEMEVEDHLGAAHHQRSPGRTGQRNGYRRRLWDTRVGAVELSVPRVRDFSWSPGGVRRGRWPRSYRKPTSTASPHARWTIWSGPSV